MPFSLRENNADYADFVRDHEIKTILDVGPGFGTYARILRDYGMHHDVQIDCVEIWEPYVDQYNLTGLYAHVIVDDIRFIAQGTGVMTKAYDLIVFGDVLEHMTPWESLSVWEWASRSAKYGMISVPIVHWPQAGTENPYEKHIQEHMHVDEVVDVFGPFLEWYEYNQTATFFKEF